MYWGHLNRLEALRVIIRQEYVMLSALATTENFQSEYRYAAGHNELVSAGCEAAALLQVSEFMSCFKVRESMQDLILG